VDNGKYHRGYKVDGDKGYQIIFSKERMNMSGMLKADAGVVDISPKDSQFLFG
jgi:hypothetical protein